MSNYTNIEWTNITWNPATGCTKISSGCLNCYAERMAFRLAKMEKTKDKYKPALKTGIRYYPFEELTPEWNNEVTFHPEELNRQFPGKGKKIFVCSMSDLFHEGMPFSFIKKVFRVIEYNHKHIFQILTKRPERMKQFFQYLFDNNHLDNCEIAGQLAEREELITLKNLWLGVTVENAETAHRIETLKQIPATVRFVSFEPLLSNIPNLNLEGIDWVIVGGETGPGARYMGVNYVMSIYTEAKKHNIPFFFKGWGTGECIKGSNLRFKKTDTYYKYFANKTWNEFPEVK